MSTTAKETSSATADYRIGPKSPWAGAWKGALGVGVVGLAVAFFGYRADPARFAFSYLFGYFVSLSLALGSMFFVLVLYMTKAAWGVTVRRVAELFMRPMGTLIVLVLPLVPMLPNLFPWMGANHAQVQANAEADHGPGAGSAKESLTAESRGLPDREPAAMRDLPVPDVKRMAAAEEGVDTKIVAHKRFFLNQQFFLVRLCLYLGIWSWLAHRYFQWSTEQDESKAIANTAAAQRFTPVAMILFALSLSFFAFDWLLSLDATWYSTIFGVYIFAQCALFQMATLILVTLTLRKSGLLGNAVTVEHFHDMGKLLFGWIAFWSYIAFVQFFLTWYANIPDEVAWFHKRWSGNGGTWRAVSLSLVAMHFFVPFWFLMSRNVKRRLPLLAAGAACMVVMHVIEVYWVIMPNVGPLAPNFVDFACLFGVFGIYLAAVLRGMVDYSLVPVGDPRLARALDFENA
ncbi:MAG TPA: hypothetical protein VN894_10165 [Polyangiaceae bacterium]|nr:hypothetical protein [Polyangiaceae bacterium]